MGHSDGDALKAAEISRVDMHRHSSPPASSASARGRIAVALHDIEPATFERCALIREWLDDHGIGRVTLLVIPARDLHPLGERSPEMARWLIDRRQRGDSIAQHGFQHEQLRRALRSRQGLRHLNSRRTAEFVGLDDIETRRAVDAGWRVLKLAGLEPDGFVAPDYAYTPALLHALRAKFRWWAGLLHLHGPPSPAIASSLSVGRALLAGAPLCADGQRSTPPRRLLAPAWGMACDRPLRRILSPLLIRAGAVVGGRTLRLDLHPADLQNPRQMLALEWVLRRTGRQREAITYDELLAD